MSLKEELECMEMQQPMPSLSGLKEEIRKEAKERRDELLRSYGLISQEKFEAKLNEYVGWMVGIKQGKFEGGYKKEDKAEGFVTVNLQDEPMVKSFLGNLLDYLSEFSYTLTTSNGNPCVEIYRQSMEVISRDVSSPHVVLSCKKFEEESYKLYIEVFLYWGNMDSGFPAVSNWYSLDYIDRRRGSDFGEEFVEWLKNFFRLVESTGRIFRSFK